MAQLARKVRKSLEDNAKVGAAAGSATIGNVRAQGLRLVSSSLPKAADATDKIGQNVADFVLSSSQSLAKTMRHNAPKVASAAGSSWLLGRAGRLLARRPAVLLIGGAAIAAIGWAAWQFAHREPEEIEPEADAVKA